MAVPKTLETLFHETLKDICHAERKILKALPKMVKAAMSPELKAAFEKHRDETEVHVERLHGIAFRRSYQAHSNLLTVVE